MADFDCPLHVMAGDSVEVHGICPRFVVGEPLVFFSHQEVLDFVATAEKKEVLTVRLPFAWGLLGGEATIVREDRYFSRPLSERAR